MSAKSVRGVPCASLQNHYIRLTFHTAKAEGEALALGKAEALAQRRELRTHRASYRKLHQSPRHWAPDHPMKRPMPTLAIPDTLPPLFCFLPPLLFFFFFFAL